MKSIAVGICCKLFDNQATTSFALCKEGRRFKSSAWPAPFNCSLFFISIRYLWHCLWCRFWLGETIQANEWCADLEIQHLLLSRILVLALRKQVSKAFFDVCFSCWKLSIHQYYWCFVFNTDVWLVDAYSTWPFRVYQQTKC